MPSPLLHCATGVAFYSLDRRGFKRHRLRCALIIVVAALLPDFDFIPGLLLGDPNRYHGGWTHSIGFAVMAGCVLGLLGKGCRLRVGIWSSLACFSHALLDTLTVDLRPPYGVPVLWPFSNRLIHVESSPHPGVTHGADAATIGEFMNSVFSSTNLEAIGFEVVAGVLLIVICVGIGGAVGSRAARSVRARQCPVDALGSVRPPEA